MTRLTWNFARGTIAAAALTALSAASAIAAPATVGTNTNLRQGPGTNFGVIMTVPGGSVVDVIRCGTEWCNVMAGGRPGYMIARNLGGGGAPVAVVGGPQWWSSDRGPITATDLIMDRAASTGRGTATMARAAPGAAGNRSNTLISHGYRLLFA